MQLKVKTWQPGYCTPPGWKWESGQRFDDHWVPGRWVECPVKVMKVNMASWRSVQEMKEFLGARMSTWAEEILCGTWVQDHVRTGEEARVVVVSPEILQCTGEAFWQDVIEQGERECGLKKCRPQVVVDILRSNSRSTIPEDILIAMDPFVDRRGLSGVLELRGNEVRADAGRPGMLLSHNRGILFEVV